MAAVNPEDPATAAQEKALLFAQVQFHIVEGHGLSPEHAEALKTVLKQNGAQQISKASKDDSIPLSRITHIVSMTSDFPDYEDAISALKAVVKPDWVKASVAKGRLANPRQYSPDPRYFFSGLVVCCADLPSGDKDAIIGGVLAMGGLYSSAVTKMVTHIVALTTDPDKCQTALNKNLKCKIVLPHWFDDCLKLGKRIDEGPYCLPDPEILRKRPEDKIPDAARHDLIGASSTDPGRLPTPSSSPSADRRKLTVFKDKKVMLSSDLELGSHLRGTIEDLIQNGGGTVTGSVHKADIFICHYRESTDYRIASRAGCDVGNLAWLYHLITHNAWTSPLKRLLHYPIARNGLPGFKDFRISLSNYNGEARVYLENLAKAAGGEFTKTMKEDNTHLITAHTVSEKCDAAKEWNINMINHLWLEESYAKWQIQSLANPRYTTFPPRTNLGEVVGQTTVDNQILERVFFPKGSDVDQEMPDFSLPKPMAAKGQNATSRVPNSSGVHPSSSANKDVIPYRNSHSDAPTPRASKDSRRHTESMALRTPAASRYADGKENDTPSTTGSRGAKDRAVAKLHDLAPDIALFEKESKRAGGVIHGGRKPSEEKGNGGGRKRSKSKDDDEFMEADDEIRGAKRAKKGREPPSMRLLLSGYKGWVGQAKKESDERAQLRDLGILVVSDPASCTHLASPQIVRTQKFASAMAHAPIVISTDFVDRCLAQNKKLSPDDFALNDVEGEKRLGFTIADATSRARKNKGHLLRGYTIYCTENIRGGFESYKSIVEANGGKCMLYRARAGSIAARTGPFDETEDDHEAEYVYLISGASPEEKKLWLKFRTMVQGVGKRSRIVRSDWMLDLALRQEVRWLENYELAEGEDNS